MHKHISTQTKLPSEKGEKSKQSSPSEQISAIISTFCIPNQSKTNSLSPGPPPAIPGVEIFLTHHKPPNDTAFRQF